MTEQCGLGGPPELPVLYGLHSSGKVMHVSDVANGLKCDCRCAGCKKRLIAVQPKTARLAHFRHEEGAECAGAAESALHEFAKYLIAEKLTISIPPAETSIFGEPVRLSTRIPNYKFEKSAVEAPEGSLWADVVVEDTQRKLIVEVVVTHRCEPEKIRWYRANNKAAIEIFLSIDEAPMQYDQREALERYILFEAERCWVSCPKLDEAVNRIKAERRAMRGDVRSQKAKATVQRVLHSYSDAELDGFDLGAWFAEPLPGCNGSPSDILGNPGTEGVRIARLLRKLRVRDFEAEADAMSTIGLPVARMAKLTVERRRKRRFNYLKARTAEVIELYVPDPEPAPQFDFDVWIEGRASSYGNPLDDETAYKRLLVDLDCLVEAGNEGWSWHGEAFGLPIDPKRPWKLVRAIEQQRRLASLRALQEIEMARKLMQDPAEVDRLQAFANAVILSGLDDRSWLDEADEILGAGPRECVAVSSGGYYAAVDRLLSLTT